MARAVLLSVSLWLSAVLPTASVSLTCRGERLELAHSTHDFVHTPETWSQAEASCRRRDGELLNVLGCEAQRLLEEKTLEGDARQAAWWVGADLPGKYISAPGSILNVSELEITDKHSPVNGSAENGGEPLFCTYIITDPVLHLVTTPSCKMRLGSICAFDLNRTFPDSRGNSWMLEEVEAGIEPSHRSRAKRNVAQLYTGLDQAFNAVNSDLDVNDVLKKFANALEMMEEATVQPTYEQKVKYLQYLLNITKENHDNATEAASIIFQLANGILLRSMSECNNSPQLSKDQFASIWFLLFQIFEAVGYLISKSQQGSIIITDFLATMNTTRRTPEQLYGSTTTTEPNGAYFILPSSPTLKPLLKEYTYINVQMTSFKKNPFNVLSDIDISGYVCGLSFSSDNSSIGLINLTEHIQIFLPRPGATAATPAKMVLSEDIVVVAVFNYTRSDYHSYTVIVTIRPKENVALQLRLALDSLPTKTYYQNSTVLTSAEGYRWLLTPAMLRAGNGTWYIGAYINGFSGIQNTTVWVTTFFTSCMYWDESQIDWSANGCLVGPQSEPNLTQCLCNHLTFFGSSILVMPNQVDLSRTAEYFSTVKENYVVPALLGAFFSLYLITLIWACRADKQARRKRKITLLADNHPCAQYSYLLSVHTGNRSRAGTSAKVGMTLQGSEGESDPHQLTDPDKPLFERGGVDIFLLTSPFSLGDLKSIQLWHDNSGGHPEWYLNKVTIQDLQTRRHWHFLCSTWLSSSKGDGRTQKTFHPAHKNEITSFRSIFRSRTSAGFRDEHIWVSVVDPPQRSPFTRAQRVSCCMCLLLCTMTINIMFWNIPQNSQAPVILKIGSMAITFDEIMVGLESALLMFPINILIITIFRSIRPRLQQSTEERESMQDEKPLAVTVSTLLRDTEELVTILSKSQRNKVPPLEKKLETYSDLWPALDRVHGVIQMMQGENDSDPHWVYCSQFVLHCLHRLAEALEKVDMKAFPSEEDFRQTQNTIALMLKKADMVSTSHMPVCVSTVKGKDKGGGCWLPWWFVFVGWSLLIFISGISTFFTLLYGFFYGKESTTRWVISLVLSLLQSIFILQPLKVLVFAMFFALTLKALVTEDSEEVDWLLAERRKKCMINSERGRP